MLVALAIFSLAALALLRLGGATATNSARLDSQAMAQMVARNIAVETLTDPEPPAFGATGGVTIDGGRRWRWNRIVARSPEARIQQIEIGVEPAPPPSLPTGYAMGGWVGERAGAALQHKTPSPWSRC